MLRVECRNSEAGQVPVRFGRGVSMREVVELLDRWPAHGYCYFRVRTSDGALYILRHDELKNSWEISGYRRTDPLPQEVRQNS